jgi:hypothetical protein
VSVREESKIIGGDIHLRQLTLQLQAHPTKKKNHGSEHKDCERNIGRWWDFRLRE